MSDSHDHAHPAGGGHPEQHPADHEPAHEGPIKTPKQLLMAVVASFIVPILVIVLLVNYVDFGTKPAAGSTGLGAEAVALRLKPIGSVEVRDTSGPALLRSGEQVYQAQCVACHATGVAGAPKFGDEAAWAPRLKASYQALLGSALKGKGAMAAQGGGDFSDLEIGRALVFMANKGGGKLAEPAAPAAAAAAAAVTTAAATPASAPN